MYFIFHNNNKAKKIRKVEIFLVLVAIKGHYQLCNIMKAYTIKLLIILSLILLNFKINNKIKQIWKRNHQVKKN
jgi:hypothetical protein